MAFPVTRVCADIVAWADQIEDIDAIREARAKLEAIDTYLARTSKDGRAEVAATMRRLEVRIGMLLGPAPTPGVDVHRGKASVATDALGKDERHDFRKMAAAPEVVEEVIGRSTDDSPASRRKILAHIEAKERAREQQSKPPPVEPISDASRAARDRAFRATSALRSTLIQLPGQVERVLSLWESAPPATPGEWDELISQATVAIEQLIERTRTSHLRRVQ